MWGDIVMISVVTYFVVNIWRFLDWVWFRPKRVEKILRKQGFKGNPYRILYGDAKETAIMYDKSYSEPISLNDNIEHRVMPFISKTIRTYGEKSFMWIGSRAMVFIMDINLVKNVNMKHLTFHKAFKVSNPIVRRLIGGLIRYEGDKWRDTRKKLNPLFHMEKLKAMASTMQKQGEKILDEWSGMVPKDGSPGAFDVYPYYPDYTAGVISQVLFSSPFTPLVKRTFGLINELTLISKQAQPFSIPGEQFFPTPRYKRANEIEKELKVTFTNKINERLNKRRAGEINGEPDLLDLLMELNDVDENSKPRASSVHEIIQQCKLFYLAGHDTTSNLLGWTTLMLAIHQDWQARAREEAFQVLGNKTKIEADDTSQLKIINMILHEVLRLYPPAVELSRVVMEDTTLGDLFIPKGTMLMLPTFFIHRDPKIWGDDVLEFKPERFAEGSLKAANGHAAFLPFGWGVRMCIGSSLALLESKVFIAMFLRKFSFELSPTYTHGPLVSLNMLPQYGIPLVMRRLV